ncbi:hypothetical protein HMPREF0083_00633 [Aneurinibacillus aneurinilyticus ATCC 12856]|uniref:Uncharacterized protein n=1 Tax=Aneurinibacillus aneurinilyticus ATCC 12856 TaxID=649747 RepID=U1YGL0_ANEAE|nr:hypothetical protein HMPREF0083_00633 [Aneurinibacillus aneurinilyticus ATCC 12856]
MLPVQVWKIPPFTTLDLVCVRDSAFMADGGKTAFRAPSTSKRITANHF